MSCEICKRGSCVRSFHSLSEQDDFDKMQELLKNPQDSINELKSRIETLELEKAELQGNWDRCFNSRAEIIREKIELEQLLAKKHGTNEWISVKERLPEPYKKELDGLRTVSDIVICKDRLNTFWTDQTYLGYDGEPFWASFKCSCVGWKPIDKSDADSRN